MSQLISKVLFGALICTAVIGAVFSLSSKPAGAVTASDWNAANIISDSQFFNPSSMSSADVQNFLNSMNPNCDSAGVQPSEFGGGTRAQYGSSVGYPPPYICLKDYFENPTTHQNNANGGSVDGGASAADIIKYAADTYGVSPKALLVILQKEQSLVTDSWPFPVQYRSATGYGCPDTAPCDQEYYGFYNQVTNAARQFQLYAKNPSSYRYKAFQDNYVQFNPDPNCGGSNIHINNQATAGLYNYTPYQPNASALNNLYGSGDSCGAYGNRDFWRIYNDWFGSSQYEETFLSFQSQLSYYGWTNKTVNNGVTGTVGQSRPMESIRIDGSVNFSTYNYNTGWQPTVSGGMVSGTIGQAKPIQAIRMSPTGDFANKYDIYYRAHVSNVGWMGWTKNGQPAGVTGDPNKDIEAVEIRLVIKGFGAPGSTDNAYQNINTVSYNPPLSVNISTHVGSIGWLPSTEDGMVDGIIGEGRHIEAVNLSLNNSTGLTGNIIYSAHLAGIGWQDFKQAGDISGTVGQFRQMEAIRIALTGTLGDSYDIWYRGYTQDVGWTGWAKNGRPTGSVGASKALEGFEVRLTPKNTPLTLSQQNNLYNPSAEAVPPNDTLFCSGHVSFIGWVNAVPQNSTCGTTGQGKPLEAIKLSDISSIFGDLSVTCSVYVKDTGWTDDVVPANTCGTTGQSKPIQAVKLSLSGTASSKYDIYYQAHVSYIGWQPWVSDGAVAGTPVSGNNIEAVSIKLIQK